VKVVDANVLLNAVNRRSPHHYRARTWLRDALRGSETIGFPWIVLVAFLRLTTGGVVLEDRLSADQAMDVVEGWLERPNAVVVEPMARHLAILRGLLAVPGNAANVVNDAHIAALAVEYGAEVVSFDRDFGRFPGVRLVVPGSA
jgi:toxin-antitoxin system PIN domain toxin